MSLGIGGRYESTACLLDRSAVDSGDHAASGLAQSDAGSEVHVSGQVIAIGDVIMSVTVPRGSRLEERTEA